MRGEEMAKQKGRLRVESPLSEEEPDDDLLSHGNRTIIGAEAFHCPVRDGKEWDHLAMVVRHNLSISC